MTSRLALATTAVAVATLSLAGCGNAASSDTTTLEVQTGLAVDSSEMEMLKELTAGFEEAHPDATIDLVPAGTDYEKDIKVRLASKEFPDIWNTHGWSLLRYGPFLLPLQDEAWAEHLSPALADAMMDDEGNLYAMPTNVDISGILYNKDVLTEAGYEATEIETWDDFIQAAKAIEQNGVSAIYAGGKDMSGAIADRLVPGAFNDAELEEMLSGHFVTQSYSNMLDMVATWRDLGLFNPDYSSATKPDMSKALAQGQAGFMFGPTYLASNALQYNPDANIGFLPMPSINGEPRYLVGGERTAFGISKKTENPKLAKEYLAYLAEPENLTKMAAASDTPPGLTNADMDLGPLQESYDAFVTQTKTPVVPYFDRVYLPNGMWSTMVTTTDAVITGQAKAESATAEMQTTFDSLFSQGK